MNRMIAYLFWLSSLGAAAAVADCTEEVIAAWRRLQSTPFSFETTFDRPADFDFRITGAFIWPSAMRLESHGPKGKVEHVYIGPRAWHYSDGRWSGGGEQGPPAEQQLKIHAYLYSLEMPPEPGHGIFPGQGIGSAACLGTVARDGRDYVAYEYKVKKTTIAGGEYTERHKLYVDAKSGLPARQEVERVFKRSHYLATEFRPDPMLKIEPPN